MKASPAGETTQTNKARINKTDNYAPDMVKVTEAAKEFGFSSLWEMEDYLNNAGYRTANGRELHTTSISRIISRAA